MAKGKLYYKIRERVDWGPEVVMAGFIAVDHDYQIVAFTDGPKTIAVEAGMPIWATFNRARSNGVPGYDVWYADEYGNAQLLDGLYERDIRHFADKGLFEIVEEMFEEMHWRFDNNEIH